MVPGRTHFIILIDVVVVATEKEKALIMQNQKMDRGTDALKAHLGGTQKMDIRQTRRGWLQELLGCEARTEMKVRMTPSCRVESLLRLDD